MPVLATILLTIAGLVPLMAQGAAALGSSPLEPAGTGGLEAIDRALVKLSSHRRLMVIGAHPDDEDTALLAFVGKGLGGEAAYLSLSRGEGGQNLIGPELGVGLGVIRTGELLAARSVEGTRQFFTRAYDFGYTRSLGETFDRWPREVLLRDAVRAVRRFMPQVVVAVFPVDDRAGHGQHQASGVIAEEVFRLAGFPDQFPDLTAEGLPPWQPEVFYRRAWWNPEEATLEFPLDQIDPFSGRSVMQIAGKSRSMHRSQDMGTLQRLGSRHGTLSWIEGQAAKGADDVFGGVDTDLAAIAKLLRAGPLQQELVQGLEEVSKLAASCRSTLSPANLSAAIPALSRIHEVLKGLLAKVARAEEAASHAVVANLLEEKLQAAAQAQAAAAGIAVDAVADHQKVAAGESLGVTTTVWNSGDQEVSVQNVTIVSPAGWQVSSKDLEETETGVTGLEQWGFNLQVSGAAGATVPYFLLAPLDGDLYDWDRANQADLGEALQQAPARAVFDLRIGESPVRLEREVVYRVRDQAKGEVRLPVRAVPQVEVDVSPTMLLWPSDNRESRAVEVLIRSNVSQPVEGDLELLSGHVSWPNLPAKSFQINEPAGQEIIRFELPAPAGRMTSRVELTAVATVRDGRQFATGYPVVSYPHIQPTAMPLEARIDVQVLDLKLPKVTSIGYVRGASDRVPEILLELGLPLVMLSATDLGTADLSRFDAIVVGSRAYEINPVLAEANSRLLSYVEEGGLLLVQYQQYQFVRAGFTPYPLEIDRPHGRVTDELAPVNVLQPEHSLFKIPNQIEESDWLGWVQERGLYFASTWDPAFVPLLSLQDDGRPLEKGALLVAEVGRGLYVYTGLSFFRQLPAGVPGAIRLFVNLLSMERL